MTSLFDQLANLLDANAFCLAAVWRAPNGVAAPSPSDSDALGTMQLDANVASLLSAASLTDLEHTLAASLQADNPRIAQIVRAEIAGRSPEQ